MTPAHETGVLMLRTCRPDGTSSHKFRWPLEPGAVAVAPDWDPRPQCGNGLHGLPWGEGDADPRVPRALVVRVIRHETEHLCRFNSGRSDWTMGEVVR